MPSLTPNLEMVIDVPDSPPGTTGLRASTGRRKAPSFNWENQAYVQRQRRKALPDRAQINLCLCLWFVCLVEFSPTSEKFHQALTLLGCPSAALLAKSEVGAFLLLSDASALKMHTRRDFTRVFAPPGLHPLR
jgi:hypothetical protein